MTAVGVLGEPENIDPMIYRYDHKLRLLLLLMTAFKYPVGGWQNEVWLLIEVGEKIRSVIRTEYPDSVPPPCCYFFEQDKDNLPLLAALRHKQPKTKALQSTWLNSTIPNQICSWARLCDCPPSLGKSPRVSPISKFPSFTLDFPSKCCLHTARLCHCESNGALSQAVNTLGEA